MSKKITTLKTHLHCSKCPNKSGDILADPKAWNGWQIASADNQKEICPDCITRGLEAKGFEFHSNQVNGKYIHTLVFRGTGA
jgi:hypothetical protein